MAIEDSLQNMTETELTRQQDKRARRVCLSLTSTTLSIAVILLGAVHGVFACDSICNVICRVKPLGQTSCLEAPSHRTLFASCTSSFIACSCTFSNRAISRLLISSCGKPAVTATLRPLTLLDTIGMYSLNSQARQTFIQGCPQCTHRVPLAKRRGLLTGVQTQQDANSTTVRCQPCRAAVADSKGCKKEQPQTCPRHRTPHSMATIARMRVSATGRRHTSSTIRKIGESKRGRTLSASHRAAISAGQKRRHATRRFLVAMEAMHQELIVTCDETSSPPPSPLDVEKDAALFSPSPQPVPDVSQLEISQPAESGAVWPPPAPSKLSSVVTASISELCTDELDGVQREYQMRLKDFRRIQAQVKPWLYTFERQHGRRASADDVHASGDAKMWELYQEYQWHKDSLMVEIPAMRAAMAGGSNSSSSSASSATKVASRRGFSCNRSEISHTDAASRLEAARQYKKAAAPVATAGVASGEGSSANAKLRMMGLCAKASGIKGGDSSRAKAAVLKALEYKKKQGAEKANPVARQVTGTAGSAVRLVAVEGKAIGGVDYSGVDASQAAAGESQHIKAGSPVQSYRILQDEDGCGMADAFQSVQSSTTAQQVGSEASRNSNASSAESEAQEVVSAQVQAGQKQPTRSAASSMEALDVLLSAADAAAPEQSSQVGTEGGTAGPGAGANLSAGTRPLGSGRSNAKSQRPPRSSDSSGGAAPSVPLALQSAPTVAAAAALQHCAAADFLELRGKQAAATAAVEAAAATAAAVVAAQAGMVPSPEMLPDVGTYGHLGNGDGIDDATSAAAETARQLHAEFESVRQRVMQHGADTYRGGLLFFSRLL